MVTLDPKAVPDARLQAVQQRVHDMNKDGNPIFVGPFSSELGFEAIYWTPFLAWLKTKVKDFDTRARIITRGGAGALYTNIAKHGIDLYQIRSVTDVRRAALKEQRRTGIQKQLGMTEFDAAVIKSVAKGYGIHLPYHVMHPSFMYWLFDPFFTDVAGFTYLRTVCDFATLPSPKAPVDIHGLPERFVAVKFYARHTFPYPHPDIAEFVKRTVATLAAQVPVVVLESADAYDDHSDIPIVGQNILSIGKQSEPHQNLHLQAAILAKATAFVGTYGGMAQLALRMGKPSISFYEKWEGIGHAHFALNSWLAKSQGIPFLTGNLNDVWLWSQLTGLPGTPAVKPVPQVVTA